MPTRFKPSTAIALLALCVALALPMPGLAEDVYNMDDSALIHFRKGQSWMAVEQYITAIREFQIGIRLKPSAGLTAALYNNMGEGYLKLLMGPKAVVSFQQAIRLDPDFALYYDNLAHAYRLARNDGKAIATLQSAASITGGDAQSLYLLGAIHESRGEFDYARDAYQAYIDSVPHSRLAEAARQRVDKLNATQGSRGHPGGTRVE